MENQRRCGQFGSRKEILLSRSLGTENGGVGGVNRKTIGNALLDVHEISDESSLDNSSPHNFAHSLIQYTDLDRQKDDEIVKRLDIELGMNNRAMFNNKIMTPKKRKFYTQPNIPRKVSHSIPSDELLCHDIIELESISSNNRNTRRNSSETSSEFIVSSSSKSPPVRQRIKNTIPGDSFERYLGSIARKCPPMTERERTLFWKFTTDVSDTEEGISYRKENQNVSKIISKEVLTDNNNERPCTSIKDYKTDKKPLNHDDAENSQNENILMSINTKTMQVYTSDEMLSTNNSERVSSPPLNLVWLSDDSVFKNNRLNPEIDKKPRRVYTNKHRKNKLDKATTDGKQPIFKVPNIPSSGNKNLSPSKFSNKIDTSRKEEFYKYLGLGTKSPNGKLKSSELRSVNRRSLRVKRLQQNVNGEEKEDNQSEDTSSSLELSSQFEETQPSQYQNNRLNLQQPPPNIRRTCGSIITSSSSVASSEVLSTKATHIIEKIDYTCPNIQLPLTSPLEKNFVRITRRTRSSKPPSEASQSSSEKSRKNGKIPELCSEENTSVSDFNIIVTENIKPSPPVLTDITTKFQQFLAEKRPVIASCLEHITYEKPSSHAILSNHNEVLQKVIVPLKCIKRNRTKKLKIRKKLFILRSAKLNQRGLRSREVVQSYVRSRQRRTRTRKPKNIRPKSESEKSNVFSPAKLVEMDNDEKEEDDEVNKEVEDEVEEIEDVVEEVGNEVEDEVEQFEDDVEQLENEVEQLEDAAEVEGDVEKEGDIEESIIEESEEKQNQSQELEEDEVNEKPESPPIETIIIENEPNPDEPIVLLENIVTMDTIAVKAPAPNTLSNPLSKDNGKVLQAFYEQDFLVVIQELKINFWKYSKVIKMFGKPQNWELLGECDRNLADQEISSPYKNRLCINETNPVYIEMRAKQLSDTGARECNLASVYVNVYYFNEWKASVMQHSVQLDTIRGILSDISYTTITNSRYFIMCWEQESFSNAIRTGLCKYSLTPDLDTLASIREFKHMRHVIHQLECLGDDKLIGFGETQVTIWDHMTGDVLTNFDFETPIGENLGSIICSIEFKDYLVLYQKRMSDVITGPQLKILAVNLSQNPHSFRLIYTHDLPISFTSIKSSLSTNDLLITTSVNDYELLLLPQQPHRLFYSNMEKFCKNKISLTLERFYAPGSKNFVEISEDCLIVKTIHEFLMDFIR